MNIETKLKELKIVLPEPKDPVGAYVAAKITGKLLFISGQVSIDKNNNLIKGKIGKELDLEQGYSAAERCGLSLIAQAKKICDPKPCVFPSSARMRRVRFGITVTIVHEF